MPAEYIRVHAETSEHEAARHSLSRRRFLTNDARRAVPGRVKWTPSGRSLVTSSAKTRRGKSETIYDHLGNKQSASNELIGALITWNKIFDQRFYRTVESPVVVGRFSSSGRLSQLKKSLGREIATRECNKVSGEIVGRERERENGRHALSRFYPNDESRGSFPRKDGGWLDSVNGYVKTA